MSRRGLRILVYRTIVEQLSALTGRSVEEIDPDGAGAEDDWSPDCTLERPSALRLNRDAILHCSRIAFGFATLAARFRAKSYRPTE